MCGVRRPGLRGDVSKRPRTRRGARLDGGGEAGVVERAMGSRDHGSGAVTASRVVKPGWAREWVAGWVAGWAAVAGRGGSDA